MKKESIKPSDFIPEKHDSERFKKATLEARKKFNNNKLNLRFLAVGDKVCYLVDLWDIEESLAIYDEFFTIVETGKKIQAGMFLLNKLWISGDNDLRTVKKYQAAAALAIYGIIDTFETELGNC